MTASPLLSIRDLKTYFYTEAGVARSVDGVSFDIGAGETLGIVGESGCGKSVTALSILRLIQPPGRIEPGSRIEFEGRDIVTLGDEEIRDIRGNRISMIFQEPMSALNPVFTVGDQVAEVGRVHAGMSKQAAWDRAVEMLALTGIPAAEELLRIVGLDPHRTLAAYPHELSGGQRQRVVIAMALSRDPRLIIADEPTTALDVTVQAQVVELLLGLQSELGFALILVSHDLALVSDVADRVAVMYGGQIVETGSTPDVIEAPAHHYARGLLGSVLSLEGGAERLTQIRGVVPSPADFPSGCRFADRCPMATQVCRDSTPVLEGDEAHRFACHHPAVPEPQKELAQ